MNSNTLYKTKNPIYVDPTNKRYVNTPNVSEIKDNVWMDGVDIDIMVSASTRHHYFNKEFNN